MRAVSYQAIPEDQIIDIQVSGLFYTQLVNNLLGVGNTLPPEQFKEILESLSKEGPFLLKMLLNLLFVV